VTETKTQVVSGKTKIVGWEPRTPSDLKLIVGADDLDSASPAETYEVEQIIVHEKFSGDGSGGNNIALLKLSRPWPGDPARLSSQIDVDPPGVTFEHPNARMLGVVTGYGISASIGKPNRLREVVLPFVEQTKCRSSYPGRVGDGEICAGFERGGADACQGFSGGPLAALTDDGCPFVVGIVAWGEGCGEPGYYGVYTRLSYYKSWLQSHVPELKFVDRDEVARGSPPAQLSEAWRAVLGAIK
jgi:secreted trypsin-like serine protease